MSVSNSKHELQVLNLRNSFCNPEWRSLIGKAVVIVKLLGDKGRELNEGKGERERGGTRRNWIHRFKKGGDVWDYRIKKKQEFST